MITFHPMQRTVRRCAAIFTALVSTTTSLGAQSTRSRRPPAVEVAGEFRGDGSCQVFADGVPVFNSADSAETSYIRGAMLNTAPGGYETHEVWCAPRGPDQPMPPLDYTERLFVIMIFAPTDHLARTGSYSVRTGMATPATAPIRANAALFGMTPKIPDDTMPIRVGLIYLAGTRGTFVVSHVDSARVVGKFTMRAQRALTM